jgi:hypothetical protein
MANVRIVPQQDTVSCIGTKVMLGDQEMSGVDRIELRADAESGVWRAVIHCIALVEGEIVAELVLPDGARAAVGGTVSNRIDGYVAKL